MDVISEKLTQSNMNLNNNTAIICSYAEGIMWHMYTHICDGIDNRCKRRLVKQQ